MWFILLNNAIKHASEFNWYNISNIKILVIMVDSLYKYWGSHCLNFYVYIYCVHRFKIINIQI